MNPVINYIFVFLLSLLPLENAVAATLPLENGDIHDIHGPVPIPEPLNWLYYLAAALAILALLVFLLVRLKKRKPEPTVEVPVYEQALAELEKARRYLEQNQSLKYAERVSEILRNYLEVRFGIHSTRQTTREFLASLEKLSGSFQDMLLPYRKSLQGCLEQCDMAKYAHKTARKEAMEQLEEKIRVFIRETTPRESE